MIKRKFWIGLGLLGLFVVTVSAMPPSAIMMCSKRYCKGVEDGPVCGIDSSGIPKTYESSCKAHLDYCLDGNYIAMVKPGVC